MLIDFLSSQNTNLYQRVSDQKSMAFSSNNNLSIRVSPDGKNKKLYRDSMGGGEDMFVCFDLLNKHKKFLIDRSLKMYHKPRKDMKATCRQFFYYGVFGNEALKNLKLRQLELFYNFNLGVDEYKLIAKIWSPVTGLIHIDFFSSHLFLFFLFLITQKFILLYLSLLLLFLFLLKDSGLFFRHSIFKAFSMLYSKYVVSLSFMAGGVKKSILSKTIFIPPHITKSKYMIPSRYYIFFKNKKAKNYKNELYKIFDESIEYESSIEYIGDNNIRVSTEKFTVIVRKYNLFLKFFVVQGFLKGRN